MNMSKVAALVFLAVVVDGFSSLRKPSRGDDEDTPDYMQDSNPQETAQRRHDLGIEKGEFLAQLFSNCTVRYNDSFHIAELVRIKAIQKIKDVGAEKEYFQKKIANAIDSDNVKDPVSGESNKMRWMDKRDDAKDEVRFYKQIRNNARTVKKWARKGQRETVSLRKKVEKEFDKLDSLYIDMESQVDDASQCHTEAEMLWKQWMGASKDYTCAPVPQFANWKEVCKDGNTKLSIKCHIVCIPGYDDPKDSKNSLRCRKEGKFGKELYGEWKGVAACVGRMCGKPPNISEATTIVRDIRFPHVSTYHCFEGFSQNGKGDGPRAFDVPCDLTGNFAEESTHVCKRVECGKAPPVKDTEPIPGTFFFSDQITYKCLPGHTVDETPGGLRNFSVSCQSTGEFTHGQKCKRVRCGPAMSIDHTTVEKAEEGDQFFGDEIDYKCKPGYSTDQDPSGPKAFTLTCAAHGDFRVKGASDNTPVPVCAPVSAGMSPDIPHGSAKPREMFYGETEVVTGDVGYSTLAKPSDGLSFILSVTTEGQFAGLKQFKPVSCGAPPSVDQAETSFAGKEAVYRNVLAYTCKDGYSTDKSVDEGAKEFSIQCEADSSYSKVPHLGYCANIDDCAGHTCGPHGSCVDHLNNYTCDCESGYQQNWDSKTQELLCGNIDDCGPEACGVGKCEDLVNDYKCICPEGYENFGDAEEKTCKAKVCGIPPSVAHADTEPVEMGGIKHSYKDTIT
jgi:hypothetical protein